MNNTNNTRYIKHENIENEKNMNERLYGRNVPSFFLQPNIDFRPISTKYS